MNKELTPTQVSFFQAITKAALANPFSDYRGQLVQTILGNQNLKEIELSEELKKILRKEIGQLDKDGFTTLSQFSLMHQDFMRYAFLFDIYHQFQGQFDDHIRKQLKSRENLALAFSEEILLLLKKRGFSLEEIVFCIGLFFQLRRAYYFISDKLIGDSQPMVSFREALWNNLFTIDIANYEKNLNGRMEDFSTLILGETGTGKGTAAQAIGMSAYIPFDLRKKSFKESFLESYVGINLSQFSPALIESELFGHKKGAFTGAFEAHSGIFSKCSMYGAIFLDEIGDVSTPIQVKLLQVMQERVYSPVGSHEKKRFSGRMIAATHQSIEQLRESGRLRHDFYYRISSDIITVPSLRERVESNAEELRLLVRVIVERILGASDESFSSHVLAVIKQGVGFDYSWPGNVRELEQCVRQIILHGHYLGDSYLKSFSKGNLWMDRLEVGTITAQELLVNYCTMLYKKHNNYEKVARLTGLDRRTVKKYILY